MSSQQPDLMYPASAGSIPIVYAAYDKWSTIAQQAFAQAQLLAQEIANIQMSPVAFNANFDPQIALAPFPTLTKPTVPDDLTFNPPTLPNAPPVITIPILPPAQYVSSLLDTMQSAIATLLGGNALPPSVAQALRDRAQSDAYAEELRATGQAYDEFAARGFFEPPGQLTRRVTEARADARNKRQQASRDVYIQEQQVAIENLRFAVTSGIQLEGITIDVYKAQAQLEISTAQLEVDQNRLVLDGWRAQVELYDTQLKGELARLDAALKEFQATVQVYEADAQVATAAGEFDNRAFQLNLAQEQAIVDTEMKRQDQQFEQMKYITSVMLEIKKTLAQVGSQLASAAMSAVNIGASASSSTAEAIDYRLSVDYSGQMDGDT
ncbi:MAG: hypothetical protein WA777_12645 [Rhodanobacter sp.]